MCLMETFTGDGTSGIHTCRRIVSVTFTSCLLRDSCVPFGLYSTSLFYLFFSQCVQVTFTSVDFVVKHYSMNFKQLFSARLECTAFGVTVLNLPSLRGGRQIKSCCKLYFHSLKDINITKLVMTFVLTVIGFPCSTILPLF